MPGPGRHGGGFALPDIDINAGAVVDDVSTVDDVYGYGDLANQGHLFDSKATKPIGSFFDNEKISTGEAGLGAVLGGIGMFQGAQEIRHGAKLQGGLDMLSGGLDVADGLTSIAGTGAFGAGAAGLAASPMLSALGPVGFAASMIAAGNGYTQDHGWWGKDGKGNNKNGFQWAFDNGKSVGGSVNRALGGGVTGAIGGGLAGTAAGLGSGGVALAGDFVGGLADSASGIGDLVGGVFGHGNAGTHAVDKTMSFIGNGAKTLGTGAANLAGGIGKTAGNVVGGVGKTLSHLW
jgi:hypothetical protein